MLCETSKARGWRRTMLLLKAFNTRNVALNAVDADMAGSYSHPNRHVLVPGGGCSGEHTWPVYGRVHHPVVPGMPSALAP